MAIFFHSEILMKTIHLTNICLVTAADYGSSWQLILDFILLILKKKIVIFNMLTEMMRM